MDLLQLDTPVTSPNKTLLVPPHIEIRELAEMLHLKPFRVVADVLALKQFKGAEDLIDFTTAAQVAQKYGYAAGRSN